MKIYEEKTLQDFEFWSGGKDTADILTPEELDYIEQYLEETAPEEGYSETEINDFFWFERDYIAELLDLSDDEFDARFSRHTAAGRRETA